MNSDKLQRPFALPNIYVIAVYMATALACSGVVMFFVMLGVFAIPVLLQEGASNPFTWIWAPDTDRFGIMPMLVGSLLLASTSIALAFPLAVAVSSWLVAIGRGRLLMLVKGVVYFMSAIPTVVYGFIAVFLLTPIIRQVLGGTGMSWLTAALMLTILILPTMVLVMSAGMQSRMDHLCPNALAMGFTRLDVLCSFVLPGSRKTLLSATILGFGRAIGDTLLALMLAGNAIQVPQHLSDSLRTLSAHMALVTANEVGGGAYNSLFAAGFLLLLINAILSISARRLGTKDAMQTWFKPYPSDK